MSGTELNVIEINPPGMATASVIWLHGLGASGDDFEPVIPHLNLAGDLNVRFIFPHAPEQPVTINGGVVMRAWYDILEQSINRKVDYAGILASSKLINQLIEKELSRGIPTSNIILAGFSQGGTVALEVGLRYQQKIAGIIALSTYLAAPDQVAQGATPIFLGHGTMDPVVPIILGKQARDTLRTAGYDVEWNQYPMEHSVCMEEIEAIGEWIIAGLR